MSATRRTPLRIAAITILVALTAAIGSAQDNRPDVKVGDMVELVVIVKSPVYDPDTNRPKQVERLQRETGKLVGITERAYHLMRPGPNGKIELFPRVQVQSISSIEPDQLAPLPDRATPPGAPETGTSKAAAPRAQDVPAANAVRALAKSQQYQQAASEAVAALETAPPAHRPALAAALAYAIGEWLGSVEYEASRIAQENDCTDIEGKLARMVRVFYEDSVRRLPSDMLARDTHLSELMSLWADSYLHRVGFLRRIEPEANQNREALEKQKKQRLEALLANLEQSIYYTESLPPNPRVLWAEAEIHAYLGDKQKAAQLADSALKACASAPGSRAVEMQIRDFQRMLPRLATLHEEGRPAPNRPTRNQTTRKTAEPKPEASAPPTGRLAKFRFQAQSYWRQYGKPYAQVAIDHPVASGSFVGFIVVFWVLPILLMRAHVAGGDVRASMYRKRVRYLGLLGYAAYRIAALGKSQAPGSGKKGLFARLFGGKKKIDDDGERHLNCASCSQPIDRVEDYALSLKFDACPHCGVAIEPVIEFEEFVRHLIKCATEQTEKARAMKNKRKRMKAEQTEAQTMARMLNGMYALAVRRRATDIHLQRDRQGGQITYRVDGMLSKPITVPRATSPALLSAVKIQAGLDITNHTTPQDGRININIEGVNFDIRINCAPTPEGEVIFLRLLDKRNIMISARQLGFQGQNLEDFEEAINRPHGLVLVTGPTGSGKSTTLYVAMNAINTGERNILTIEDPVEYRIDGLKQMQVNPDKDFTFATGLRSILRQDPDVIMVGEIRDHETANMAVEAAMTGHLVFSTLHTMDTASAVSRLSDLGVNAQRYASALTLIVAQRLVRLICGECKQVHLPTDAQLQKIGLLHYKEKIKFQAGLGCPVCNYSGYYGRRAILEILNPNDKMRVLMETECRPHVIRDAARQHGMRVLREAAALKVVSGETTVDEVIRITT